MIDQTAMRIEVVLSILLFILFGCTLIFPDWMEKIFDTEPYSGSGEFEWGIVILSGLLSLLFGALAQLQRLRLYRALGHNDG